MTTKQDKTNLQSLEQEDIILKCGDDVARDYKLSKLYKIRRHLSRAAETRVGVHEVDSVIILDKFRLIE